ARKALEPRSGSIQAGFDLFQQVAGLEGNAFASRRLLNPFDRHIAFEHLVEVGEVGAERVSRYSELIRRLFEVLHTFDTYENAEVVEELLPFIHGEHRIGHRTNSK